MVVMGTHGRTGLVRAVIGSVADKIVRRSPVPVVLVPLTIAGMGWYWTRNAPAAIGLLVNPGSLLAALYCIWSWLVARSTASMIDCFG